MDRHHYITEADRVRVVRLWLLQLAWLLCWLLWPQTGEGLCLAFLFPSCLCCDIRCTDACTEGWQICTVTFVDIANDVCTACDTYNATWVCPLQSGGPSVPCSRQSVTTDGPFENCNTEGRYDTFAATVRITGGTDTAVQTSINIATAGSTTDSANFKDSLNGTVLGTAPVNCGDYFPLDLPNFLDFPNNTCDPTAATSTLDFQ